jgi:Zeta toxin
VTGEAGLDPFLHALQPARHDDIFRHEIVPDVLDIAPPVRHPWAIALGGQAGSGKTFLKRSLLLGQEDQDRQSGRPASRPVDLGTDELRDYHPDWRLLLQRDEVTAAFYATYDCRRWVDEAITYSISRHPSDPAKGGPKPIIFDTQLSEPARARDLLSRFRASGYHPVHVAFAAISVPVSQLGALQRYWEQRQQLSGGRYAADPGASDAGPRPRPWVAPADAAAVIKDHRNVGCQRPLNRQPVDGGNPERGDDHQRRPGPWGHQQVQLPAADVHQITRRPVAAPVQRHSVTLVGGAGEPSRSQAQRRYHQRVSYPCHEGHRSGQTRCSTATTLPKMVASSPAIGA